MNLFQRLRNGWSGLTVQDRYEDATFFGERSWLPASIQEARQDADQSTRLELVRRSRYWARNSSLATDLGDVFAQYVVGARGLQIIPSYAGSLDSMEISKSKEAEEWDETAAKWWKHWSRFPCVDFQLPLAAIQDVIAHTWWHDGEVFIYKTYSRESGRPRIQLIEGHRIVTPPELRSEEGRSIIDGVEFKPDPDGRPSGRPIKYWLRTDSGNSGWYGGQIPPLSPSTGFKWLPAEQVIHVYRPTRPGMYRGLPMLTGRMNDCHDLDDLQGLEKKAAREAAKVTNVVTTKTGEAQTNNMRRQKWQVQGQDAAGNPIIKNTPLFYETTMGGETVYQMIGEKFEQFKSERPSVATKDYWDYLVRKIAGPMHVLVLPGRAQGTQYRAMLEVCNSFFRMRTTIMSAAMRGVYSFVMGWAVNYDRSLDGAPKEWWHCDVIPPRSVIVDLGRSTADIVAGLKSGTRTFRDECGELGRDWRATFRQKAIEAAFRARLADEYEVDARHISELASESIRITETAKQTEAEIEENNPGGAPKKPEPEKTAPQQSAPITVNVENSPGAGKRTISLKRDDQGRLLSCEVEEAAP